MNFIYSLTLSFRDLGRWDIKKISLINGLIWLFIWLIIGYISWDFLIQVSVKLLNIMPFSFIKLSGAFIIYTILWIQAIFLTIGIIFSLFNEGIGRSAQEGRFNYIGITIGSIIIIFWSIVFWIYKGSIIDYISHFLKVLPFETVEELMSIFLTSLFLYLLYSASISFSFLFFVIEKLKDMAVEEDLNLELNDVNYTKLILLISRDFFGFIFLAFLLYPIMLVPFLNILVMTFLWAYMIKDSYYHVINSIFGIELEKKELWTLSITSTILNFLPIINIFVPALGILNMYHYGVEKGDKIDF